jgi:hypothetical protein
MAQSMLLMREIGIIELLVVTKTLPPLNSGILNNFSLSPVVWLELLKNL